MHAVEKEPVTLTRFIRPADNGVIIFSDSDSQYISKLVDKRPPNQNFFTHSDWKFNISYVFLGTLHGIILSVPS